MIHRWGPRRILLLLLLTGAPISWSSEIEHEGSKGSNAADENELAWPAIRYTTAEGFVSGNCLIKWLFATGLTRMQVAAGYCDAETVQRLLDRGFDIEEINNEEKTALHVASRTGNTETVLALIENGADIEAVDHKSYTPLHKASIYGNTDTVLALIENGADIHARDSSGDTPLHLAAGSQGNAEIIIALAENGADIDAIDDSYGSTPLHSAAVVNPALVPMLVELGADMEVINDKGATPLEFAVLAYEIEGVRILLEQGADMSRALIYAAITGNVKALPLLVEALISRWQIQ